MLLLYDANRAKYLQNLIGYLNVVRIDGKLTYRNDFGQLANKE